MGEVRVVVVVVVHHLVARRVEDHAGAFEVAVLASAFANRGGEAAVLYHVPVRHDLRGGGRAVEGSGHAVVAHHAGVLMGLGHGVAAKGVVVLVLLLCMLLYNASGSPAPVVPTDLGREAAVDGCWHAAGDARRGCVGLEWPRLQLTLELLVGMCVAHVHITVAHLRDQLGLVGPCLRVLGCDFLSLRVPRGDHSRCGGIGKGRVRGGEAGASGPSSGIGRGSYGQCLDAFLQATRSVGRVEGR